MKIPRPSMPSLLNYLLVIGTISNAWPPKANATRLELILRDIAWGLCTINMLFTMVPLIMNITHTQNGIPSLMMALSELNALFEVLSDMTFCRLGRTKLQKLLERVEDFLELADEKEEAILEKYIDRYWGFHVLVFSLSLFCAVIFSCGPIFLSTSYPVEGWYPFSTESPVRRVAVYVSQVVAILLTGCGPIINITIAMFLFCASARLEYLCSQLNDARTEADMRACVRKHQDIIRFVEEVEDGVRYIVTKTSLTMASTVICAAFPLVYNPPLTVLLQFCCMVVGGCEKLYITVWAADDLSEMSQQVALAAFSADWVDCPKMSSSILFMIRRSQKPLVIKMVGFLPPQSLEYFSTFLKTILSYFMTMRAIIEQ